MVKDPSDSEKGNPLPPRRLLLSINSKGSFICTIPRPLLHQSWSTGWNENLGTECSTHTDIVLIQDGVYTENLLCILTKPVICFTFSLTYVRM